MRSNGFRRLFLKLCCRLSSLDRSPFRHESSHSTGLSSLLKLPIITLTIMSSKVKTRTIWRTQFRPNKSPLYAFFTVETIVVKEGTSSTDRNKIKHKRDASVHRPAEPIDFVVVRCDQTWTRHTAPILLVQYCSYIAIVIQTTMSVLLDLKSITRSAPVLMYQYDSIMFRIIFVK